MTVTVSLVGEDGQDIGAPRRLLDIARPFVRHLLGQDIPGLKLQLVLLAVPGDDNDLPGLQYHTDGIGFALLIVRRGDHVAYRHPHGIGEILAMGLRDWVQAEGAAPLARGYRLIGPDLSRYQGRLAPAVAGVTAVEPYAPGEKPGFTIRRVAPPALPVADLARFGASMIPSGAGQTDLVKVLINPALQDDLLAGRFFSPDVEEGGFLVGEVYEDGDQPGTHIARVTAALPAQQTGASLLHFTFTGDSFEYFKRSLDRDYPGQRLLGWYHTHLFPATSAIGLSSIDYRLHFNTFRLPWQVAGLVNIDDRDRVLRFYVRERDDMALCQHQPVRREPVP